MREITLEFILFALVSLIITFGIYFFVRRYWKEKFIRISLLIAGLFWILFGYIQLKYGVLIRIWAVIDAPYNQFALQEFLSYDVLPILAILLTGASFILYSSILLKNPARTPLKWFVRIILYIIIFSGCLMSVMQFIRIYYQMIHIGNFITFLNRYRNLGYLQDYLFPLFILFTGFCLLELVRLKTNLRTENTEIHYRTNKMILLPIATLVWIGAGMVNLIVKLLKEHNVFHGWEWDGSFMEVVFGIADYFIIEQLFYILIGILLFIIWTWCIPRKKVMKSNV